MARSISIILLLLAAGACGLPRDADGTLERVRGGTLRVGVVIDTPWVTEASGGAAGGIEGAMVAELAVRLHARPEWVHATEAEMMEALKSRELDLVIGGLTAKSPYAKEIAFTRPYYTDTVAIGATAGSPADVLKGRYVAVKAGDPAAGEVRKKGATPVNVPDLKSAPQGLMAAPTWQLQALALRPTGVTLRQAKHVMAVAPGENAFLVEVEGFLDARRDRVPGLLRRAAR